MELLYIQKENTTTDWFEWFSSVITPEKVVAEALLRDQVTDEFHPWGILEVAYLSLLLKITFGNLESCGGNVITGLKTLLTSNDGLEAYLSQDSVDYEEKQAYLDIKANLLPHTMEDLSSILYSKIRPFTDVNVVENINFDIIKGLFSVSGEEGVNPSHFVIISLDSGVLEIRPLWILYPRNNDGRIKEQSTKVCSFFTNLTAHEYEMIAAITKQLIHEKGSPVGLKDICQEASKRPELEHAAGVLAGFISGAKK